MKCSNTVGRGLVAYTRYKCVHSNRPEVDDFLQLDQFYQRFAAILALYVK